MKKFITFIILSLSSILSAEEVAIEVDGKVLKGELNVTEKKTSRVAFLVSGSGPTDKDGNTLGLPGKNNCLKYLSEYLNEGGMPTLRVDKRGVGASSDAGVEEVDLRFSTYVEDIGHWIGMLEEKGFTEIVLIGHSEGALVATLAAKHKSVIGLVSVAGAGRPASDVLREQLKPKLPKGLYEQADKAISSLAKGEAVKDFPPSLNTLFRPSVQPYLISWFNIDPAKALSGLTVPVLIVQGATDLQVTLADAKLLHAASKGGEIKVIEGMNHVLKEVEGDEKAQMASYFDPEIPIHQDLGDFILKFTLKPIN